MKIAVMGSGGLGGLYGGRLAHAGYDVTFIARGAHMSAMKEQGLLIENDEQGEVRIARPNVTDDPAAVGVADYVLLAVKLWDTDAAVSAIRPMVGPRTVVISLQNGVIKDDILRREFGEDAVIGAVAYVATHVARPGVIRQTGTMQRLVLGEYDGQQSPRVAAAAERDVARGYSGCISDDIRRTIWEKYVFLVGLSGTTATMRSTIGPIRQNAQSRAFLYDLLKETVAVGRAHGVRLPSDYADDRLAFLDTVPATMTSSMHHDLEKGNRLEVAWLSGGVVELGRAVNVATPANRAVRDILALHAGGRTN